jgi:hypothetical protein
MTSDRTLKLVQDNTDDAIALGIRFTPMIFINGVEYLWYYGGKQTPLNELVDLAIDEINRGGGGLVAPPSASEKMVEDWRRGRVFNPPGHDSLSWRGDGPIEFVVWGDYQAPFSIELDNEINTFLTKNGERIKYAFRPFPVDDSCNAGVSGYPTKYDGSCQLSKLVEAVNLLSGNEKRWEMHDWILSQQQPVSVTKAMDEASRLSGLDYGVLQDVMGGIDVSNRVRLDIMSKNGVWRRGLPVITVNGRYVPKWKSKSVSAQEFFKRIVDIAESENVGGIDASDGARR